MNKPQAQQFKTKDSRDFIVRAANENDVHQLIFILKEIAKEEQVTTLDFDEASRQIGDSESRLENLLKEFNPYFFTLLQR